VASSSLVPLQSRSQLGVSVFGDPVQQQPRLPFGPAIFEAQPPPGVPTLHLAYAQTSIVGANDQNRK
jgi:hypothetical protein